MKRPWWASLDISKILSKKEKGRRSQRKKRKYKHKTPTQALKAICEKYGISQRGSTQQVVERLLRFISSLITDYLQCGAPNCFSRAYQESLCEQCDLIVSCEKLYKDMQRIKRAKLKYLVKQKLKGDKYDH